LNLSIERQNQFLDQVKRLLLETFQPIAYFNQGNEDIKQTEENDNSLNPLKTEVLQTHKWETP